MLEDDEKGFNAFTVAGLIVLAFAVRFCCKVFRKG